MNFNPAALAEAISQAQSIVQAEVAPKFPGLSIAVAVNGETVWSQEYGFADLETKTPVTRATRFRIGSVSKPLTAAGLALLVERGLLDLDAPIQKYIPDFPEKDGVITTRMLAGHLSGIRNYRGLEATSNKPFPNLRSGLKVFENDPLESPPGTKFSYASYNWNTLGVVMEAAAQQDFLSFLQDNVLQPLGLADTVPDRAGAVMPQRVRFYETGPQGEFFAAPPVDLSYCWPAGGFLSTAEDMARFGSAHYRKDFFKPESLKLLLTSQKISDGAPTHYGIGWFIGRTLVYHGGDSMGGIAILMLQPSTRTVVALVANGGQGWLLNGIRRGKIPVEAKQFLFDKNAIAHKIVNIFATLYNKPV